MVQVVFSPRKIPLIPVMFAAIVAAMLLSDKTGAAAYSPKIQKSKHNTKLTETATTQNLIPLKIEIPPPVYVDNGRNGMPRPPRNSPHFDKQSLVPPPQRQQCNQYEPFP